MASKDKYLGVDIGSVAISMALLNANKEIIRTAYEFHEGRIAEKFTEMMQSFDLKKIKEIASTSSTPKNIKSTAVYDNRISFIIYVTGTTDVYIELFYNKNFAVS